MKCVSCSELGLTVSDAGLTSLMLSPSTVELNYVFAALRCVSGHTLRSGCFSVACMAVNRTHTK